MPLLPGENAASYEHMLTQVIADVDPKDALQEFWLRTSSMPRGRRVSCGVASVRSSAPPWCSS
jgi:hypothetical protein